MNDKITLNEIMEDLQSIEPKLLEYEKKYQLISTYFYKLYTAGKLEENWDFQNWAGLYEIKLDREAAYRNKIPEVISRLHLKESVVEELLLD